jgi:hypothetical protein
MGLLDDAIRYYHICVDNPGRFTHKYNMFVELSQLYSQTQQYEPAFTQALKAIEYDPTRAEGYVQAGLTWMSRKQALKALPFFMSASTCSRPAHVDSHPLDYTLNPQRQLTRCYGHLRQYKKSLWHAWLARRHKATVAMLKIDLRPAWVMFKQHRFERDKLESKSEPNSNKMAPTKKSTNQTVPIAQKTMRFVKQFSAALPFGGLKAQSMLIVITGRPGRYAKISGVHDPEHASNR